MGGKDVIPKVPDYRIYYEYLKRYQKLQKHQEMLAKEGLKDPWIRNEAWRYENTDFWNNRFTHVRYLFFRGCLTGLALATVLFGVEKLIQQKYPRTDGYEHAVYNRPH